VGAEGEAPKDDWHWQDASPQGCIKTVQEWLQGKYRGKEAHQGDDFRCINHLSTLIIVGLGSATCIYFPIVMPATNPISLPTAYNT